MLTFRSFSVLLLVVPGLPVAAADVARVAGSARAVDGDTLVVADQRVRLFGIDAPEHDQRCEAGGASWDCGGFAQKELARRIAGQELTCTGKGRDRYDRLLATCDVAGQDLGAALVAAGAATAYRRYSDDYVGEEGSARAAGLGIWRGAMQAPEAFRHDTAEPVAVGLDGCSIKGNISGNGRIYHLPGQEHYANTRVDPKRGEAWFCTEAEARAAGFRKAKQ